MANQKTYMIETNVGYYGGTEIRTMVHKELSRCVSCAPLDGEAPKRGWLVRIERPAQYPLWVAMGVPSLSTVAGTQHTDRGAWLTYAAYWERAGARVTWPRSIRKSEIRYHQRLGQEAYRTRFGGFTSGPERPPSK